MLKRKYGNHPNWTRILKRRYTQNYVDTKEFAGYISLLEMVKVREPLILHYGEKEVRIVDNGYMWLQQFPFGKNHSITTTFDYEGKLVQWYIDICLENGVEDGIPYLDDLFLDIVVLPSGEVILLDEDELDQALADGMIDKKLYDLAWLEAERLLDFFSRNEFDWKRLAHAHQAVLTELLEGSDVKVEK